MERLTEQRGQRTWNLYHIGWYLNLLLVILILLVAVYYLAESQSGEPAEADGNMVKMAMMVIVATILLMGAGVSRYQARLEGQHLEIKLALNRLMNEVERLRGGGQS